MFSSTKALELIKFHWDFFRRIHDLPVVPPAMTLTFPDGTRNKLNVPNQTKGRKNPLLTASEARTLRFCFDPTRAKNEEPILKKKSGLEDGIKAQNINQKSYYFPNRSNHRALESMCVAETNTGKRVLCLFQSKINAELKSAVEGLNAAAQKLQEVWPGGFLFVVFALKSDRATLKASDHPILLVTEELLPKYFTSTLAPAAQLAMKRHQRSLKKSK
jgi:hypothetical protein